MRKIAPLVQCVYTRRTPTMIELFLLPLIGIVVTCIGYGLLSRKKNPTAGIGLTKEEATSNQRFFASRVIFAATIAPMQMSPPYINQLCRDINE